MRFVVAAIVAIAAHPTYAVEEPVMVRVYSVADLVTGPPQNQLALAQLQEAGMQVELAADAVKAIAGGPSREEAAITERLRELVDVLTTATVPDQWESSGGDGRIVAYQKTLSLIVRQTPGGHEEVQELLTQLRAENSVRIQIRIEYLEALPQNSETVGHQPAPAHATASTYSPPAAVVPAAYEPQAVTTHSSQSSPATSPESAIGAWIAEHGRSIRSTDRAAFDRHIGKSWSVEQLHNGLASNGRSFGTAFGKASAVMSPDRRSVEFHLCLPILGAATTSTRLRSGDIALVEVAVPDDDTIYLLVTAEIQVPEEDEELLLDAR